MEVSISEQFPGLSPFTIRREKATEVFLLMRRLSNYNQYQAINSGKKNIIRRPAGDDWF